MTTPYGSRRESGVVLVVGLVFLMLMTLIGVAAMQSSSLQERMAGMAGDRDAVFQSAERALQAGEAVVIANDCPTLEAMLDPHPNPDDTDNWVGETSVDPEFDSTYTLTRIPDRETGAGQQAEDTLTCGGFYFVTAKAETDKGMIVVLQSTVHKRY